MLRRGIPTASEFSRIITPAKGELAAACEEYINQLIGDIYDPTYGQHDDYVSAAMKSGTDGEPAARAEYAMLRDCVVQQVGFITTDDGKFGCSPDSLVNGEGGLELKCPLPKTQVKYLRAGILPPEYKPQVHGCLWITGRSWWDFLSYCPGLPPFMLRVTPDDYTKRLGDVLIQFRKLYDDASKIIADKQPEPSKLPVMTASDIPQEVFF